MNEAIGSAIDKGLALLDGCVCMNKTNRMVGDFL